MLDFNHITLDVMTALMVLAAVLDVRSRRVPNWLTMPGLVTLLTLRFLAGGWSSLGSSLAASLIAAALFGVFFVAGGMGGGDVKLIATVGAGVGLEALPTLLVLTSLCGGAMAIVIALRHGKLRETIANVGTIVVHHQRSGLVAHPELRVSNTDALHVPYAGAIAAGGILTLVGERLWR